MKLSILICHLMERERQLDDLMAILALQQHEEVEYIVNTDNGEMSIGAKRNALLEDAIGDYVCFVDDDDRIADFYVQEILKAIESGPDCVGFNGAIVHKNGTEEPVTYRMGNTQVQKIGNVNHCGIGHLSPVKRELALSVKYPDVDAGEDYQYAKLLQEKLKTEAFIDKTMYYYLQDNKK